MKKYVCDVCGYIYDEEIGDPDNGVEAGTKWEGGSRKVIPGERSFFLCCRVYVK